MNEDSEMEDVPLNVTLSGHAMLPSAAVMLPGDATYRISRDACEESFDFNMHQTAPPATRVDRVAADSELWKRDESALPVSRSSHDDSSWRERGQHATSFNIVTPEAGLSQPQQWAATIAVPSSARAAKEPAPRSSLARVSAPLPHKSSAGATFRRTRAERGHAGRYMAMEHPLHRSSSLEAPKKVKIGRPDDDDDDQPDSAVPLHEAAQIPRWGGDMLTGLATHAVHAHNLITGYRQYYKYISLVFQILFTTACFASATKFWHASLGQASPPALVGMPVWRWALFGASIFPSVHLSRWLVACALLLGEMRLTRFKNSMYIMIGIASPLRFLVTMSLLQALLAFLLGWTTYDHLVHSAPPSPDSGAHAHKSKTLLDYAYTIARGLFMCANIFAAVDLVKIFCSKLIALNVQAEAFFTKIQDTLHKEWMLNKLLTKRWETWGAARLGQAMGLSPEEAVKNMKIVHRHLVAPYADQLSFAEQVARLVKEAKHRDLDKDVEMAAFYLWWNCRSNLAATEIGNSDFAAFFDHKEAADAMFELFDTDGDGCVTYDDVTCCVRDVYRDRRNLAYNLIDSLGVVHTLELIVGAAFHGCAVFVYLVIFGVDVGHLVISLSSVVVALTLIFGGFLRTIFEGVVFLFMVHPYDVGEVLQWSGALHVVNEIGLLNTVLLKWDGRKIFVPNSRLMTEEIINMTRSKALTELHLFEVDVQTPVQVVPDLQLYLQEALKAHPADFTGKVQVDARSIADPLKYQIAVYVDYAFPGDDFRRLCAARGLLMLSVGTMLTRYKTRHSYMYHAINYNGGSAPTVFEYVTPDDQPQQPGGGSRASHQGGLAGRKSSSTDCGLQRRSRQSNTLLGEMGHSEVVGHFIPPHPLSR